MSTIVLRSVKGSPLTNTEVDTNFSNLNTDKTELGGTYSAGTANGVLFLSSSKVLTTGSALTFDGGQLVINGAYATNADDFVYSYAGGTSGQRRAGFYLDGTNGQIRHFVNNAEQMRLTSTGLGIGTSSPAAALQVASGNMRLTNGAGFATGNSLIREINAAAGASNQFVTSAIGFRTGAFSNEGVLTFSTALFTDTPTERMRLDSSGNLGIGTSSPSTYGSKIVSYGSTADTFSGLSVVNDSATAGNSSERKGIFAHGGATADGISAWVNSLVIEGQANGGVAIGSYSPNASVKFYTGTSRTERMRLDSSGNLGIGTSSPGAKLDISANGEAIAFVRLTNTQASGRTYSINNGFPSVGALSIYDNTAAATRVVLDSSGNLGLGVTPGGWQGDNKALQVANASFWGSTSLTAYASVGSNYAVNSGGGYGYISSNAAADYYQFNGAHVWRTAPSGTAGDAISFTQAMTLDASGNLGVGTTSPASRLHVSEGTGREVRIGSLTFDNFSGDGSGVAFSTDSTSSLPSAIGTLLANSLGIVSRENIVFATGGANSYSQTTERARIDSSGNFLLGTTSYTPTPAQGVQLNNPSGEAFVAIGHLSSTPTGNFYASFNFNSATIGSITQSGTTAVLYNVTSDQRLKENIVDAPEFGSVIDSIKVRSYDWKTDQTHQRAGFVAQELVTVAPEAVHQPADPEGMMAVDYSKLVPMLVKEIQSLRARLAAANI